MGHIRRKAGLCSLLLFANSPFALAEVRDLTTEEVARYRDLDVRPLHTFNNVDLADYLRLRDTALPEDVSPPAKIGLFA